MSPSYTSLIKKVKEFSKRFDCNFFFTAILTNGDTGRGIKKNDIYVC